jgi:YHS domain-containing protein
MNFRLFSACAAVALGGPGCSSLPPVPPPDAPVQHCMVCRYRRDFSCLEVERRPSTPHARHAGRDYCFCSEACRDEFQRDSERYVK